MAQDVVQSDATGDLQDDQGNPITAADIRGLATGTAYTQTYSTAAQTVPAAVAAITGGESPTEAEHNLVVADLLAIKKVINSIIDDLQAAGIVS